MSEHEAIDTVEFRPPRLGDRTPFAVLNRLAGVRQVPAYDGLREAQREVNHINKERSLERGEP